MLGGGARDNAGRLVHAFDAMLLCSTIEGMPLAALEALVEGVPLVSTPVAALPGLLAHGGGTLVGTEADEIAAALATTLAERDDEGLRSSAAWARASFGIDRLARDLEQIFDEAIEHA